MENLTVLHADKRDEWNKLVYSFENYDVFYLYEYAKAFQMHGDGEPLLFYYVGQGVRGINVVMRRDIAEDARFAGILSEGALFDFVTPYGYGGWLLEGEGDFRPIYEAYIDWCKSNHIVCEFIRFSLYSNSRTSYYGTVVRRTNNIVRMLDQPLDAIRMDFEHKVRKNIKKAESSGLEFVVDQTGALRKEFLAIYYGSMDRNHAELNYYFQESFFQQLEIMDAHFCYFHVLLEKQVIASELVLIGTDTMYSYLGGTDAEFFSYRPNDYLKYRIIQWGNSRGLKRFVLGGGYGADDGIFRYKKSFAPTGIVPFYTGQAIFREEDYRRLVKQRTDLPKDSFFFPLYRA